MTKKLLYAMALGQLDGGTVYFYDVAESFMTQLLQILPNPPAVDFEQLKQWWIDCSIHAPHSSVIKNYQVKELSFDSSFFIA